MQILHSSAANSPRPTSTQARTFESRNFGEPQPKNVSDRAVISYKARAALNEMRRLPEVDLSIKALMSSVPLAEQTATQVLARIQKGYYEQPVVMRQMAAILTEVLEAEVP